MRTILLSGILLLPQFSLAWGFFGHQKINSLAVFLLPPEMMVFFKPNQAFLTEHSVDPDKRRYAIAEEGPRHYIDLDHYGNYPFDSLPRNWEQAKDRFTEDSLNRHGIVPWWVMVVHRRLTQAFREKDGARILKLSAELGHYLADAHVPLHTSSNHNGQKTNQVGIHGFCESRIPELLAEKEWDFFIGPAVYLKNPSSFIWQRVLESAVATDSVLVFEKQLSEEFPADRKYAFESRNGLLQRQYSTAYTLAYDKKLNGMVERRMRQSIFTVASFWYTAWVNAGQPDLSQLQSIEFTEEDRASFLLLHQAWAAGKIYGRKEE